MKITLCAKDIGPCNVLRIIAKALSAKGAEVVEFCEGKEVPALSDDTKLLILGMSSSENLAKDEIRLAEEAVKRRIEVIYVADTFGVWNRNWFRDVIIRSDERANIFVVSDDEVIAAKQTYPNARVTATGNPYWDKFFNPKKTREVVRLTLGLGMHDKIMLCPWGKSKEVNILHGQKAIEVAYKIGIQQVLISPHPKDPNPLEEYYPLAVNPLVPVRFITDKEMSCPDLLPAADLVFESASTIGVEAVCQRIPVVTYLSNDAMERLKMATGSDKWPLCEQGASFLYRSDADIEVVQALLDGSLEVYREKLECLYPKPARIGIVLERVMEQIEGIIVLAQ